MKKRGGQIKVTDKELKHWMAVYDNHVGNVAKHFEISTDTLYIRCRTLNLKTKGRTYLRKFTYTEFMEMFNKLRGNQIELAIHFNCCITTIKKAINHLGITTRRQERDYR